MKFSPSLVMAIFLIQLITFIVVLNYKIVPMLTTSSQKQSDSQVVISQLDLSYVKSKIKSLSYALYNWNSEKQLDDNYQYAGQYLSLSLSNSFFQSKPKLNNLISKLYIEHVAVGIEGDVVVKGKRDLTKDGKLNREPCTLEFILQKDTNTSLPDSSFHYRITSFKYETTKNSDH